MAPDTAKPQDAAPPASLVKKPISAAAQRALDEAAARRAERDRLAREQSQELQGRGGLDPVRYGDWEVNGRASDF